MGETMDKAKGRTKEALGDLTDDQRLKTEGKMDRAGAEVKEKVGEAVDAVKEKARSLNDKARDALERKRNRR
jgi:uncharacterized protein YjbJ (UPF0337 family)